MNSPDLNRTAPRKIGRRGLAKLAGLEYNNVITPVVGSQHRGSKAVVQRPEPGTALAHLG